MNFSEEEMANSSEGMFIVQPVVRHCARCGQDHENLIFKLLYRIIEDDDGTLWTRWAVCPNTHDPILWRSVKSDSETS